MILHFLLRFVITLQPFNPALRTPARYVLASAGSQPAITAPIHVFATCRTSRARSRAP